MVLQIQEVSKEIIYTPLDVFITVSIALLSLILGASIYFINRFNKINEKLTNNDYSEKHDLMLKDLENLEKEHKNSILVNLELFGKINVTLGQLNTTIQSLRETILEVKKDLKDDINRRLSEQAGWIGKVEKKVDALK